MYLCTALNVVKTHYVFVKFLGVLKNIPLYVLDIVLYYNFTIHNIN